MIENSYAFCSNRCNIEKKIVLIFKIQRRYKNFVQKCKDSKMMIIYRHTKQILISKLCLIHILELMESSVNYGETSDELRKRIEIARSHALSKHALHSLNIVDTQYISNEALKMELYVMDGLANKNKAAEVPKAQENQLPKKEFNPFIDIDFDLHIKDMGMTHRLLFNKFNIYDNHLLVVTKQFQAQTAPISFLDLAFTGQVCEALNGIVFFNGGPESGASQKHKHLQILPEAARKLPILSQLLQYARKKECSFEGGISEIYTYPYFQFLHGMVNLTFSKKPIGQRMYLAYQKLHKKIIEDNKVNYDKIEDYNLIACESFVFLVARRQQKAFGVSVNTLGYMGSLLFKSSEELYPYVALHSPSAILNEISLPMES